MPEFDPSSFSSITRERDSRSSRAITSRSSSPGWSREQEMCGVRGYLTIGIMLLESTRSDDSGHSRWLYEWLPPLRPSRETAPYLIDPVALDYRQERKAQQPKRASAQARPTHSK